MLFMTKEARERKKAETYNMKESKQHDTSTDVYMWKPELFKNNKFEAFLLKSLTFSVREVQ